MFARFISVGLIFFLSLGVLSQLDASHYSVKDIPPYINRYNDEYIHSSNFIEPLSATSNSALSIFSLPYIADSISVSSTDKDVEPLILPVPDASDDPIYAEPLRPTLIGVKLPRNVTHIRFDLEKNTSTTDTDNNNIDIKYNTYNTLNEDPKLFGLDPTAPPTTTAPQWAYQDSTIKCRLSSPYIFNDKHIFNIDYHNPISFLVYNNNMEESDPLTHNTFNIDETLYVPSLLQGLSHFCTNDIVSMGYDRDITPSTMLDYIRYEDTSNILSRKTSHPCFKPIYTSEYFLFHTSLTCFKYNDTILQQVIQPPSYLRLKTTIRTLLRNVSPPRLSYVSLSKGVHTAPAVAPSSTPSTPSSTTATLPLFCLLPDIPDLSGLTFRTSLPPSIYPTCTYDPLSPQSCQQVVYPGTTITLICAAGTIPRDTIHRSYACLRDGTWENGLTSLFVKSSSSSTQLSMTLDPQQICSTPCQDAYVAANPSHNIISPPIMTYPSSSYYLSAITSIKNKQQQINDDDRDEDTDKDQENDPTPVPSLYTCITPKISLDQDSYPLTLFGQYIPYEIPQTSQRAIELLRHDVIYQLFLSQSESSSASTDSLHIPQHWSATNDRIGFDVTFSLDNDIDVTLWDGIISPVLYPRFPQLAATIIPKSTSSSTQSTYTTSLLSPYDAIHGLNDGNVLGTSLSTASYDICQSVFSTSILEQLGPSPNVSRRVDKYISAYNKYKGVDPSKIENTLDQSYLNFPYDFLGTPLCYWSSYKSVYNATSDTSINSMRLHVQLGYHTFLQNGELLRSPYNSSFLTMKSNGIIQQFLIQPASIGISHTMELMTATVTGYTFPSSSSNAPPRQIKVVPSVEIYSPQVLLIAGEMYPNSWCQPITIATTHTTLRDNNMPLRYQWYMEQPTASDSSERSHYFPWIFATKVMPFINNGTSIDWSSIIGVPFDIPSPDEYQFSDNDGDQRNDKPFWVDGPQSFVFPPEFQSLLMPEHVYHLRLRVTSPIMPNMIAESLFMIRRLPMRTYHSWAQSQYDSLTDQKYMDIYTKQNEIYGHSLSWTWPQRDDPQSFYKANKTMIGVRAIDLCAKQQGWYHVIDASGVYPNDYTIVLDPIAGTEHASLSQYSVHRALSHTDIPRFFFPDPKVPGQFKRLPTARFYWTYPYVDTTSPDTPLLPNHRYPPRETDHIFVELNLDTMPRNLYYTVSVVLSVGIAYESAPYSTRYNNHELIAAFEQDKKIIWSLTQEMFTSAYRADIGHQFGIPVAVIKPSVSPIFKNHGLTMTSTFSSVHSIIDLRRRKTLQLDMSDTYLYDYLPASTHHHPIYLWSCGYSINVDSYIALNCFPDIALYVRNIQSYIIDRDSFPDDPQSYDPITERHITNKYRLSQLTKHSNNVLLYRSHLRQATISDSGTYQTFIGAPAIAVTYQGLSILMRLGLSQCWFDLSIIYRGDIVHHRQYITLITPKMSLRLGFLESGNHPIPVSETGQHLSHISTDRSKRNSSNSNINFTIQASGENETSIDTSSLPAPPLPPVSCTISRSTLVTCLQEEMSLFGAPPNVDLPEPYPPFYHLPPTPPDSNFNPVTDYATFYPPSGIRSSSLVSFPVSFEIPLIAQPVLHTLNDPRAKEFFTTRTTVESIAADDADKWLDYTTLLGGYVAWRHVNTIPTDSVDSSDPFLYDQWKVIANQTIPLTLESYRAYDWAAKNDEIASSLPPTGQSTTTTDNAFEQFSGSTGTNDILSSSDLVRPTPPPNIYAFSSTNPRYSIENPFDSLIRIPALQFSVGSTYTFESCVFDRPLTPPQQLLWKRQLLDFDDSNLTISSSDSRLAIFTVDASILEPSTDTDDFSPDSDTDTTQLKDTQSYRQDEISSNSPLQTADASISATVSTATIDLTFPLPVWCMRTSIEMIEEDALDYCTIKVTALNTFSLPGAWNLTGSCQQFFNDSTNTTPLDWLISPISPSTTFLKAAQRPAWLFGRFVLSHTVVVSGSYIVMARNVSTNSVLYARTVQVGAGVYCTNCLYNLSRFLVSRTLLSITSQDFDFTSYMITLSDTLAYLQPKYTQSDRDLISQTRQVMYGMIRSYHPLFLNYTHTVTKPDNSLETIWALPPRSSFSWNVLALTASLARMPLLTPQLMQRMAFDVSFELHGVWFESAWDAHSHSSLLTWTLTFLEQYTVSVQAPWEYYDDAPFVLGILGVKPQKPESSRSSASNGGTESSTIIDDSNTILDDNDYDPTVVTPLDRLERNNRIMNGLSEHLRQQDRIYPLVQIMSRFMRYILVNVRPSYFISAKNLIDFDTQMESLSIDQDENRNHDETMILPQQNVPSDSTRYINPRNPILGAGIRRTYTLSDKLGSLQYLSYVVSLNLLPPELPIPYSDLNASILVTDVSDTMSIVNIERYSIPVIADLFPAMITPNTITVPVITKLLLPTMLQTLHRDGNLYPALYNVLSYINPTIPSQYATKNIKLPPPPRISCNVLSQINQTTHTWDHTQRDDYCVITHFTRQNSATMTNSNSTLGYTTTLLYPSYQRSIGTSIGPLLSYSMMSSFLHIPTTRLEQTSMSNRSVFTRHSKLHPNYNPDIDDIKRVNNINDSEYLYNYDKGGIGRSSFSTSSSSSPSSPRSASASPSPSFSQQSRRSPISLHSDSDIPYTSSPLNSDKVQHIYDIVSNLSSLQDNAFNKRYDYRSILDFQDIGLGTGVLLLVDNLDQITRSQIYPVNNTYTYDSESSTFRWFGLYSDYTGSPGRWAEAQSTTTSPLSSQQQHNAKNNNNISSAAWKHVVFLSNSALTTHHNYTISSYISSYISLPLSMGIQMVYDTISQPINTMMSSLAYDSSSSESSYTTTAPSTRSFSVAPTRCIQINPITDDWDIHCEILGLTPEHFVCYCPYSTDAYIIVHDIIRINILDAILPFTPLFWGLLTIILLFILFYRDITLMRYILVYSAMRWQTGNFQLHSYPYLSFLYGDNYTRKIAVADSKLLNMKDSLLPEPTETALLLSPAQQINPSSPVASSNLSVPPTSGRHRLPSLSWNNATHSPIASSNTTNSTSPAYLPSISLGSSSPQTSISPGPLATPAPPPNVELTSVTPVPASPPKSSPSSAPPTRSRPPRPKKLFSRRFRLRRRHVDPDHSVEPSYTEFHCIECNSLASTRLSWLKSIFLFFKSPSDYYGIQVNLPPLPPPHPSSQRADSNNKKRKPIKKRRSKAKAQLAKPKPIPNAGSVVPSPTVQTNQNVLTITDLESPESPSSLRQQSPVQPEISSESETRSVSKKGKSKQAKKKKSSKKSSKRDKPAQDRDQLVFNGYPNPLTPVADDNDHDVPQQPTVTNFNHLLCWSCFLASALGRYHSIYRMIYPQARVHDGVSLTITAMIWSVSLLVCLTLPIPLLIHTHLFVATFITTFSITFIQALLHALFHNALHSFVDINIHEYSVEVARHHITGHSNYLYYASQYYNDDSIINRIPYGPSPSTTPYLSHHSSSPPHTMIRNNPTRTNTAYNTPFNGSPLGTYSMSGVRDYNALKTLGALLQFDKTTTLPNQKQSSHQHNHSHDGHVDHHQQYLIDRECRIRLALDGVNIRPDIYNRLFTRLISLPPLPFVTPVLNALYIDTYMKSEHSNPDCVCRTTVKLVSEDMRRANQFFESRFTSFVKDISSRKKDKPVQEPEIRVMPHTTVHHTTQFQPRVKHHDHLAHSSSAVTQSSSKDRQSVIVPELPLPSSGIVPGYDNKKPSCSTPIQRSQHQPRSHHNSAVISHRSHSSIPTSKGGDINGAYSANQLLQQLDLEIKVEDAKQKKRQAKYGGIQRTPTSPIIHSPSNASYHLPRYTSGASSNSTGQGSQVASVASKQHNDNLWSGNAQHDEKDVKNDQIYEDSPEYVQFRDKFLDWIDDKHNGCICHSIDSTRLPIDNSREEQGAKHSAFSDTIQSFNRNKRDNAVIGTPQISDDGLSLSQVNPVISFSLSSEDYRSSAPPLPFSVSDNSAVMLPFAITNTDNIQQPQPSFDNNSNDHLSERYKHHKHILPPSSPQYNAKRVKIYNESDYSETDDHDDVDRPRQHINGTHQHNGDSSSNNNSNTHSSSNPTSNTINIIHQNELYFQYERHLNKYMENQAELDDYYRSLVDKDDEHRLLYVELDQLSQQLQGIQNHATFLQDLRCQSHDSDEQDYITNEILAHEAQFAFINHQAHGKLAQLKQFEELLESYKKGYNMRLTLHLQHYNELTQLFSQYQKISAYYMSEDSNYDSSSSSIMNTSLHAIPSPRSMLDNSDDDNGDDDNNNNDGGNTDGDNTTTKKRSVSSNNGKIVRFYNKVRILNPGDLPTISGDTQTTIALTDKKNDKSTVAPKYPNAQTTTLKSALKKPHNDESSCAIEMTTLSAVSCPSTSQNPFLSPDPQSSSPSKSHDSPEREDTVLTITKTSQNVSLAPDGGVYEDLRDDDHVLPGYRRSRRFAAVAVSYEAMSTLATDVSAINAKAISPLADATHRYRNRKYISLLIPESTILPNGASNPYLDMYKYFSPTSLYIPLTLPSVSTPPSFIKAGIMHHALLEAHNYVANSMPQEVHRHYGIQLALTRALSLAPHSLLSHFRYHYPLSPLPFSLLAQHRSKPLSKTHNRVLRRTAPPAAITQNTQTQPSANENWSENDEYNDDDDDDDDDFVVVADDTYDDYDDQYYDDEGVCDLNSVAQSRQRPYGSPSVSHEHCHHHRPNSPTPSQRSSRDQLPMVPCDGDPSRMFDGHPPSSSGNAPVFKDGQSQDSRSSGGRDSRNGLGELVRNVPVYDPAAYIADATIHRQNRYNDDDNKREKTVQFSDVRQNSDICTADNCDTIEVYNPHEFPYRNFAAYQNPMFSYNPRDNTQGYSSSAAMYASSLIHSSDITQAPCFRAALSSQETSDTTQSDQESPLLPPLKTENYINSIYLFPSLPLFVPYLVLVCILIATCIVWYSYSYAFKDKDIRLLEWFALFIVGVVIDTAILSPLVSYMVQVYNISDPNRLRTYVRLCQHLFLTSFNAYIASLPPTLRYALMVHDNTNTGIAARQATETILIKLSNFVTPPPSIAQQSPQAVTSSSRRSRRSSLNGDNHGDTDNGSNSTDITLLNDILSSISCQCTCGGGDTQHTLDDFMTFIYQRTEEYIISTLLPHINNSNTNNNNSTIHQQRRPYDDNIDDIIDQDNDPYYIYHGRRHKFKRMLRKMKIFTIKKKSNNNTTHLVIQQQQKQKQPINKQTKKKQLPPKRQPPKKKSHQDRIKRHQQPLPSVSHPSASASFTAISQASTQQPSQTASRNSTGNSHSIPQHNTPSFQPQRPKQRRSRRSSPPANIPRDSYRPIFRDLPFSTLTLVFPSSNRSRSSSRSKSDPSRRSRGVSDDSARTDSRSSVPSGNRSTHSRSSASPVPFISRRNSRTQKTSRVATSPATQTPKQQSHVPPSSHYHPHRSHRTHQKKNGCSVCSSTLSKHAPTCMRIISIRILSTIQRFIDEYNINNSSLSSSLYKNNTSNKNKKFDNTTTSHIKQLQIVQDNIDALRLSIKELLDDVHDQYYNPYNQYRRNNRHHNRDTNDKNDYGSLSSFEPLDCASIIASNISDKHNGQQRGTTTSGGIGNSSKYYDPLSHQWNYQSHNQRRGAHHSRGQGSNTPYPRHYFHACLCQTSHIGRYKLAELLARVAEKLRHNQVALAMSNRNKKKNKSGSTTPLVKSSAQDKKTLAKTTNSTSSSKISRSKRNALSPHSLPQPQSPDNGQDDSPCPPIVSHRRPL